MDGPSCESDTARQNRRAPLSVVRGRDFPGARERQERVPDPGDSGFAARGRQSLYGIPAGVGTSRPGATSRHPSMKVGSISKVLLLLLGASAAWCEPAEKLPAETPGAIQEELEQTLRQIRELRQGYYAHRQALEDRIRARAEQAQSLHEKRDALKAEVGKLKARIQEVDSAALGFRGKGEGHERLCKKTRELLKPFIKEQREAIERGLPYRVEKRVGPLLQLRAELGGGKTAVSGIVESAWLFTEGELREAAVGSAYTDQIHLPGDREKPARFCHLGYVFLGFVTEDGEQRGYATRRNDAGDGPVWVLNGQDHSLLEVRDAVWVLDRRAPPRLLLLPITVQFRGEGDEQE